MMLKMKSFPIIICALIVSLGASAEMAYLGNEQVRSAVDRSVCLRLF